MQLPDDVQNMKRLEDGGILARWEWSQYQWNEMVRYFNKQNIYRSIGFKIVIPVVLVGIVLAVMMFLELRPIDVFYVCFFLIIGIMGTFYIFSSAASLKIGQKPVIVISKAGMLIGDKYVFWNEMELEVKISKVDALTHSAEINLNVLGVPGGLYDGVGPALRKYKIPVPLSKNDEANKVVSALDGLNEMYYPSYGDNYLR